MSVSPVCKVNTAPIPELPVVLVFFNTNPVSALCVKVISESAPKDKTALSDNSFTSSPPTMSFQKMIGGAGRQAIKKNNEHTFKPWRCF